MDLLDTQGILIRKTVSKCLETSCEYSGKVVITKRNRELMRGDFELRAPKLGKTWPSATTILIGKVRFTCFKLRYLFIDIHSVRLCQRVVHK